MRVGGPGRLVPMAVLAGSLALAGCHLAPDYPPTITPIYAGTSTGLWVFDGSGWTQSAALAGTEVTCLAIDGSGAGAGIYAGTASSGVLHYDGVAWSPLPLGLGSTQVNSLFQGSSLYAATPIGVSVLDYDKQSWATDATRPDINCAIPFGSYLYIAADSGLFVYNGGKNVQSFAPGDVVAGSLRVATLAIDSNQDIIAGTDQGLNVLFSDSLPYAFKPSLASLAGMAIHGFYIDGKRILYIASSGGMYRYKAGSPLLLLPLACFCVYVDGAGLIYAGTASGLQTSADGGSTWKQEPSVTGRVNCVLTTAPLYSF